MLNLFIDLLQIALGHKEQFMRIPSEREWNELFLLAKKQALLGICYVAIERLPAEQRPVRSLLVKWFLTAEHIKELNDDLNSKAIVISKKFKKDGFRNVILKGQGVAQYYKIDGLEKYRTPGDVDIWLDGNRNDIIRYVRQYITDCTIVYHHVDFPKMDGVDVEIHFTPSWMNCYFTNQKLQRFFEQNRNTLFFGCGDRPDEIPVPTLAFNRIYILVHIYRHLFHEGIGLRQLMDYYYVLRQGFTKNDGEETMRMLRVLKMERFTCAVMWVLQEVFGLAEACLLTRPNEHEGRFLLNEILRSGNFGRYDERMHRHSHESDLVYGLRKVKRNFRFVYSYPSEVLWSPLFKLWHYFWRKNVTNSTE